MGGLFLWKKLMNYCQSKNLSQKTMMSYEQTLRLFSKYLQGEKNSKR
ncbi:site-specific integrase [Clostridium estertheticum]|nr:site-specific integrase [Clostridium estertheticum]